MFFFNINATVWLVYWTVCHSVDFQGSLVAKDRPLGILTYALGGRFILSAFLETVFLSFMHLTDQFKTVLLKHFYAIVSTKNV